MTDGVISELDGCMFRDAGNTQYLIRYVESDISQLVWRDGIGTCLDPKLPRRYEFRVYEVEPLSDNPDVFNYGLSGQFRDIGEMIEAYGIRRDEIRSLN